MHVPRRFYVEALPGIPTIRVFEALACGIPLLSAPWSDAERLFTPGEDYLIANDGDEMARAMRAVAGDRELTSALAAHGLATVRARHTCERRAGELSAIVSRLKQGNCGCFLMNIAFYGSSLLSSYWNGAATYYRGLLKDLAGRGHRITFYEPDAFERQQHLDIAPPDWAISRVYQATPEALRQVIAEAAAADVVIKASGVGVFDDELLNGVMAAARPAAIRIFLDVDAPATLAEMRANPDHPVRAALPLLDFVATYGGGPPVIRAYEEFGARRCTPVYNALDPGTHHPVQPDARFHSDLAFLGNRLPDREARVEAFFLAPAAALSDRSFVIGGAGWDDKSMPANVRRLGHVYTRDHNALNSTALAVLNIARDSMAEVGFSPATRVFEAAGAGACIITDAWQGVEMFLAPGEEILVARDGRDVVETMRALTPERAKAVGEAARRRVLKDHTYERRGALLDALLREGVAAKAERSAA